MLAAVAPAIPGLGIVAALNHHLRAASPDDLRASVGKEAASLGVIRVFCALHIQERKPPIVLAALIENEAVPPAWSLLMRAAHADHALEMRPYEILVSPAPFRHSRPRACRKDGWNPSEIRMENAAADESRIVMAKIHERRSRARSRRCVKLLVYKTTCRHVRMRSDVASHNIVIVAGSVREKLRARCHQETRRGIRTACHDNDLRGYLVEFVVFVHISDSRKPSAVVNHQFRNHRPDAELAVPAGKGDRQNCVLRTVLGVYRTLKTDTRMLMNACGAAIVRYGVPQKRNVKRMKPHLQTRFPHQLRFRIERERRHRERTATGRGERIAFIRA